MNKLASLLLIFVVGLTANAQSVINSVLKNTEPSLTSTEINVMGCGDVQLRDFNESIAPGYKEKSDDLMREIQTILINQATLKSFAEDEVVTIQVVFHVVYNEDEENLADSVLHNQIQILNETFRRTNADTINTRPEFLDIVGDAKIEFQLASIDPDGNPTDGIVRKETDITHFGGVLPYTQYQTAEITEWANDSLFYNFFRITDDELGGSNAWDTDRYLNIWIGDLRIFEPLIDDFEEIVYFALALPPLVDLPNWHDSITEPLSEFTQGILMHYPVVGSNNPVLLPNPYQQYNNLVKSGKMLVHEVGHYLGLRHIWGDGDCSVDDFIDDTPNSNSDSGWGCSHTRNTCVDDINGVDLPDMVENYMDYSRGNCQNSFTKGQIDFMRYVLGNHREGILAVDENKLANMPITIYPNPTNGEITLKTSQDSFDAEVEIMTLQGQVVYAEKLVGNTSETITINGAKGVYLVKISSKENTQVFKLIKQ